MSKAIYYSTRADELHDLVSVLDHILQQKQDSNNAEEYLTNKLASMLKRLNFEASCASKLIASNIEDRNEEQFRQFVENIAACGASTERIHKKPSSPEIWATWIDDTMRLFRKLNRPSEPLTSAVAHLYSRNN